MCDELKLRRQFLEQIELLGRNTELSTAKPVMLPPGRAMETKPSSTGSASCANTMVSAGAPHRPQSRGKGDKDCIRCQARQFRRIEGDFSIIVARAFREADIATFDPTKYGEPTLDCIDEMDWQPSR
jgi:hypothetical protein